MAGRRLEDLGPAGEVTAMPDDNNGVNGLAVASLVLGIVWIFWIGSVLAVIFGHVALSQLKEGGSGKGLAVAGLTLGYVGIGILALGVLAG